MRVMFDLTMKQMVLDSKIIVGKISLVLPEGRNGIEAECHRVEISEVMVHFSFLPWPFT